MGYPAWIRPSFQMLKYAAGNVSNCILWDLLFAVYNRTRSGTWHVAFFLPRNEKRFSQKASNTINQRRSMSQQNSQGPSRRRMKHFAPPGCPLTVKNWTVLCNPAALGKFWKFLYRGPVLFLINIFILSFCGQLVHRDPQPGMHATHGTSSRLKFGRSNIF